MKAEEKEFIREEIGEQQARGAMFVSKGNARARVAICNGCEYAKDLADKIPMVKIRGCGICGCPFSTKPKFAWHFSLSAGHLIKTECPHPDGNKWAEVDKVYN